MLSAIYVPQLLFCTPITETSTQMADLELSGCYVCGLRDRSCPKLVVEMRLTCLKPLPGSLCLHRKHGSPQWYFLSLNGMFFWTMVPPQLCCVIPLWVLPQGGWIWPVPPIRKWNAEEFDYLLQVPAVVLWAFYVADLLDVESRSSQCAVCGYFQRPQKETQIEYFLRVMVLVQTMCCMLGSSICESQATGISGALWVSILALETFLETEMNQ